MKRECFGRETVCGTLKVVLVRENQGELDVRQMREKNASFRVFGMFFGLNNVE